MKRRLSLSMPYGDAILDKAEASLVERALSHLRRTCAPDAASLAAQLERLELLGTALEQAPSLISSSTLGGSTRDERTLVEQLSHMDPLGGELALPEKAVTAHAYQMAKISLLRAFVVALGPRAPGAEDALCRGFRDELAQSIYTAIATEILIGVLCDDYLPERTKTRAARQLVLIWERAALVEVDDFCPMLESAWQARNHLTAGFGALLGTAEYLRLVQQNCSAQFLEFFTREAVSVSETQAFQEFLFGLPFEDLERLRAAMAAEHVSAIDSSFATRVLQRPMDEGSSIANPESLYRSYRRRRTAAEYRRITKSPGPLRVAEAYLMVYVLDMASLLATGQFAAVRRDRSS